LADFLLAKGLIDAPRRALLEALVAENLKLHGDARRGLASLSVGRSTLEVLERSPDAELSATLAHVGSELSTTQ
jgi:hypothetical protein